MVSEPIFRQRAEEELATSAGSFPPEERAELLETCVADVYGFGPLQAIMSEPGVNDIVVTSPNSIFVDRGAGLSPSDVKFRSEAHLFAFVVRHLSRVGKAIDRVRPVADATLLDGSRLHVVGPPVSDGGIQLSIRRFGTHFGLEELVSNGSLTPKDAAFLRDAVAARKNLIVAGGPGAGKTTLMAALLSTVDPAHRIVGIEDVPELRPRHPQYVRLLTRESNSPALTQTSVRDLVREALRMRPDRLVVGEVRGPEALDMISAMSTGMDGSMTTIHASSSAGAMTRLEGLVRLASGSDQATAMARNAVDLVVFIQRQPDGRRVIRDIAEPSRSQ